MNALHIALLLAAGFAAGVVNAIAGGGSLISFPALVAAGLSTKAASVTNSICVAPGYAASVYGSRRDLTELAKSRGRGVILGLVPTTIVCAAAGSVLLLATPTKTFNFVVPFLVIGAAFVLAFQQRLRNLVGHPRDMSRRRRAVALHSAVGLCSVYGGYFNAALGVILIAGIGLVLDESLARVTALKNAVSMVIGVMTVLIYSLFGPVHWVDVALLAPATIAGGYLGARLAQRLPPRILRVVVVTLAFGVGVVLLVKAFA